MVDLVGSSVAGVEGVLILETKSRRAVAIENGQSLLRVSREASKGSGQKKGEAAVDEGREVGKWGAGKPGRVQVIGPKSRRCAIGEDDVKPDKQVGQGTSL